VASLVFSTIRAVIASPTRGPWPVLPLKSRAGWKKNVARRTRPSIQILWAWRSPGVPQPKRQDRQNPQGQKRSNLRQRPLSFTDDRLCARTLQHARHRSDLFLTSQPSCDCLQHCEHVVLIWRTAEMVSPGHIHTSRWNSPNLVSFAFLHHLGTRSNKFRATRSEQRPAAIRFHAIIIHAT